MANKFNGKILSVIIALGIAGCSAISSLDKPPTVAQKVTSALPRSAKTPKPTTTSREGVVDTVPISEPTKSTPPPEPSSTPYPTFAPTPTPYPCPSDGSSLLWGELIPAASRSVGHELKLTTACYGGDNRPFLLTEKEEEGLMVFLANVDEMLMVLVDMYYRSPERAAFLFQLNDRNENKLEFRVVRKFGADEIDLGGWKYNCSYCQVTYNGLLEALPGLPKSHVGDVVQYNDTEKTLLLSPGAEARWEADRVNFSCAPYERYYVGSAPWYNQKNEAVILRKVSVGQRFIVFMRELYSLSKEESCYVDNGKTKCSPLHNETIDFGAWVLAKDGQWYKTKVFGLPVDDDYYSYDKEVLMYGYNLPIWSRQLGGFVVNRAMKKGSMEQVENEYKVLDWRYVYREYGPRMRLITEDELAANLVGPVGCRAY